MGDHMPVHLGAMPLSVRHALDAFRLGPGDVAIVNDPFRGGTHLPDITAVSGVFLTARKAADFYVASRAHHADVGGMSPGSMPLAREIYQEGLRIPPVLLMRAGKPCRDVMEMILANVRTPEEREGDLLAQVMAARRGEARLREISQRYGLARVKRSAAALLDYTERVTRAMLREIPEGAYRFEDFLDNDGVSEDAGTDRGCGANQRRQRRGRLHRVEPAGGRLRECQLCDCGLGGDVLFPLPDRCGGALQRGAAAAGSGDRAGAQRGECGASGRHGGGQRGDLAAHYGYDPGRAGAGFARAAFRPPVPAP